MTPDHIKAQMQAHRIYYVVTLELPRDEFGSDAYFADNPDDAKRIVTERLNDGTATCKFLCDEHDFGNGNSATVRASMPWDETDAEVLQRIAAKLEEEEYGEDVDCTP